MKESERLYFRPLASKDAQRLFEIYSNAEAMKFRFNKPLKDFAEAVKMANNYKIDCNEFTSTRYAVIENKLDLLIGTALIKHEKLNNVHLIGYSIDKAFWRKGYGTEIVQAQIQHLKLAKAHLTKAWVHKNNLASIKILQKLDFNIRAQNEFESLLLFELNIKSSIPRS